MSVETCAVHINALLLDGQLPIVAELDGKIVGEAEVFLSEEPINGEPKRIAHLDVIEVHPKFRRMGIGRALIEHIDATLRGRIDFLTAQPSDKALEFYKKTGF